MTPSPDPTSRATPATDWTLVALGDSIASEGAGDATDYPHLYANAINELTGKSVAVNSFASGAETSTSVLSALRDRRSLAANAVASAEIITITVGGNDADPFATYPAGTRAPAGTGATCLAAYNPSLEANFDAILKEIEALRAGKPTLVRPTSSDYNPFIGWDESPSARFGVDFYRQVANAERNLVCSLAKKHGAVCADFYMRINGPNGTLDAAPYLEVDHAHPSRIGRESIAEVLISTGLAPLR